MSELQRELIAIEEELGSSSADAYRRHLAEDAVLVLPVGALDRDACIAAIESSPPWDEYDISEPRVLELGPDAAALTYRWHSRRGESAYSAPMTSVYARRDRAWRLVLHQQTPVGG